MERLLLVDPATRRSEFDRLKDSAQAATLGKFKDRLAYLAGLDALGPTEQWLDGIPPGKIAHIVVVADLMGHATLDTTRSYTRSSEADGARAIDQALIADE